MHFLIVDDTPEVLRPLTSTLQNARHQVTVARDIGNAWRLVDMGQTIDLIVIDIALERSVSAFSEEQRCVQEALTVRGYGELPGCGQALGLRLWRQRASLKIRYCYMTNHQYLWLPRLDAIDPEFQGAETPDAAGILDKSGLWANNVEDKWLLAYSMWIDNGWLEQ